MIIKKLSFIVILFLCSCSKQIPQERIIIPKEINYPKSTKSEKTIRKIAPLTSAILNKNSSLLIAIDAGHGGKDQGAQSKLSPKFLEKHLTLSTVKMLEGYLREYGFRTILTRRDDSFIDLKERARFANEKKCDYFISVHYNAAENIKADGIEVYYYKTEKDAKRSHDSKQLATLVLDNIITKTKSKSRGIKHGNFAVIRETKMPAILIEGGFMTNKEEMDRIKKVEYMRELALGIAQGFKKYISKQSSN